MDLFLKRVERLSRRDQVSAIVLVNCSLSLSFRLAPSHRLYFLYMITSRPQKIAIRPPISKHSTSPLIYFPRMGCKLSKHTAIRVFCTVGTGTVQCTGTVS